MDPYAQLRRIPNDSVVSVDVFDTLLLRDHTTETRRLVLAARRAASRIGVDAVALMHLRWWAQEAAYRAVALADPCGEATLKNITATVARALGRDAETADALYAAEVEVDAEHVRLNRKLVAALAALRRRGVRTIAVSDTIYSAQDLQALFQRAGLRADLLDAVYTSADLGRTKHAKSIFEVVLRHESVSAHQMHHVGDNLDTDYRNASRAGWNAIHLPRKHLHRLERAVGAALAHSHRRARGR